MSIWGLLQFSTLIGISDISIYGDSKVIIEWLKDNFNLQVMLINQWCQRVKSLKGSFKQIYFRHISRNFNARADNLSKDVISIKYGTLWIHEFLEALLIHEEEVDLLNLA